MIQVKEFIGSSKDNENNLNKWLKNQSNIKVIDIKVTTPSFTFGNTNNLNTDYFNCYAVIFKINKKEMI